MQMEKSTSKSFRNIQRSKSGSKPLHTASSEKNFTKMDNWLLKAGRGRGVVKIVVREKKLYTQLKTKKTTYVDDFWCQEM
jgi:hypothetical protein